MAIRPSAPGAVERFHEIALLGMLAAGYFAMAGSLDWITAGLTLAALLTRVLMLAGWIHFTFPPRLGTALGFLGLLYYAIDTRFLSQSFILATVHLVCYLAVIKILSASTRRDFAWVRVIALLELLAASLVSASPSFFLFLALFILCAIAAFASGEVLRSMAAAPAQGIARAVVPMVPRRLAFFSTGLFAGILILAGGLFFVLPRTARAALQRFVPQRYRLPGFANEISLGAIGEIKQNSTPVMHIRPYATDGVLPPLRWRGAALTNFDGKRWYNPRTIEEDLRLDRGVFNLSTRPAIGRTLRYEVQLSAIASDTLFFAGTPQTVTVNLRVLRRGAGGSIHVPRLLVTGLRYAVYAVLEDDRLGRPAEPEPLSDAARRELLLVPNPDTRVGFLAREMAQGAVTHEEEARAIERHLRQDYRYTLELPEREEADPISHFLFVRRKGHCEYFASAMAVMLRTMGIPSRVATGFLSGVYNPVTGWQVVRASDAHSWVEAWIEGKGWVTFDPTPPDPNPAPNGLLTGVALLSDAIGQFWQDWVLSYDIERQIVLASRIDTTTRRLRFDWLDTIDDRWDQASGAMKDRWPWLAGAGLLAAAWAMFGRKMRVGVGQWMRVRRMQRGEADASDATLLYSRMLDSLEARGFRRPPWVTPTEFAGMLPASDGRALVEQMTLAYNQCRFGGHRDAAARMVTLLEQIENAPLRPVVS